MTPQGAESAAFQAGSFGDLAGGLSAAGGIAAALFRREKTGEVHTVDVALLGVGMWLMASQISGASKGIDYPVHDRREPANPFVNSYKTADDRWLFLCFNDPDPYWEDFCEQIQEPDLLTDDRYSGARSRSDNSAALTARLDAVFASKTLAQWKEDLRGVKGVWSPAQSPEEIVVHEQVRANGFLAEYNDPGEPFAGVASPMKFSGEE